MLSLPSCSTRLEDLKSPFSSIGLSDDLEEFTEEYADKENLVLRFGYVKWRGGNGTPDAVDVVVVKPGKDLRSRSARRDSEGVLRDSDNDEESLLECSERKF